MDNKDIGDILKRLRVEAGHSQTELADRMSVGLIVVTRVEEGDRDASLEILRAWGRACEQELEVSFARKVAAEPDLALPELLDVYRRLTPEDRALLRDFGRCLAKDVAAWRDVLGSQVDVMMGRTQDVKMPALLPVAGAPAQRGASTHDIADLLRAVPERRTPVAPAPVEAPDDADEEGFLAPLEDLGTGAAEAWTKVRAWWDGKNERTRR